MQSEALKASLASTVTRQSSQPKLPQSNVKSEAVSGRRSQSLTASHRCMSSYPNTYEKVFKMQRDAYEDFRERKLTLLKSILENKGEVDPLSMLDGGQSLNSMTFKPQTSPSPARQVTFIRPVYPMGQAPQLRSLQFHPAMPYTPNMY